MNMCTGKPEPIRGRPREFDLDEALDRALQVFWEKGYEGASLSDLTDAMGISRPSLYSAFGCKEALFHQVLERYVSGPASYFTEALDAPTARDVADRLLLGAVNLLTCPHNPHGCLTVQGALSSSEEAEPIRRELISLRLAKEAAIRRRFEQAKSTGDLPADTDAAVLARYLATIMQGLSVQAAGGASRQELLDVIEIAMRVWPT